MLTLNRVLEGFDGALSSIFIKETKGESGASAIQFIYRSKSDLPKYRLCIFSKGLQALFDENDRNPSWVKENMQDLRISSYNKVDEETNTKYTVYQLKHKDEESKVVSADDFFGAFIPSENKLKLDNSDIITEQDEFNLFKKSFEYDTRNLQKQEVDENAINSAVAGVGAGSE